MSNNSSPIYSPDFTQDQIDELNAHNLTSFFQIVYIREANLLISYNLENLSEALNVSTKALNTLNTIQDLHNNVTVVSKPAFDFNYEDGSSDEYDLEATNDPEKYMKNYSKAASAYFGTPIDPIFAFSSESADGFEDFRKKLENVRDMIKDTLIPALEETTPTLPDGSEDPTTLLANLRVVLKDIPDGDLSYNDCKKWALDKYDVHSDDKASEAGTIQNHITAAITSAESLNNTQSEKVRSYLFIFEEYYKSAGSGLQAINQILTKIADNISR